MAKNAYITVITNESYFNGLKVLLKSIRKSHTNIPFYVLMPIETDTKFKNQVEDLGVFVLESEGIYIDKNFEQTNLYQAWNQTFFKLNIMKLIQFDKLVYIDSDMIVLRNLDKLFQKPSLSATVSGKAMHPEWTEFNSGLMVIEPDYNEFEKLVAIIPDAIQRRQKLGLGYGDQDVFNELYYNWNELTEHDLEETYNVLICFVDSVLKKYNLTDIKELYVLHYIGYPKIWNRSIVSNIHSMITLVRNGQRNQAKAILLYLRYLYL